MENNQNLSLKAFNQFCTMLDNREWKYAKDEEKLLITTGVKGDDFSIDIRVVMDPDALLIRLYSPLAFYFSAEKLVDGALSVCIINDCIVDGNFDLDVTNGRIAYRMALSYRENLFAEGALTYFLEFAIQVIDEYNDKLFMVEKGMLTPQQLLDEINQGRA